MEKIDKAIEILQTFKEGKTIEYCTVYDDGISIWRDITNATDLMSCLYNNYRLRVKPRPKYRPYKNVKEFLNHSIKHHNWIINESETAYNVVFVNNKYIACTYPYTNVNCDTGKVTFEDLLKYKWFDDGSVCGVLDED